MLPWKQGKYSPYLSSIHAYVMFPSLFTQDALNKLLKDIFAKGSDETKRAMAKSFQTSGGTVLSTNWNEVKEKDYDKEITAPKGQEVKRWGSE